MGRKTLPTDNWRVETTDEMYGRMAIVGDGAERYSAKGPIALVCKRHRNARVHGEVMAVAPIMLSILRRAVDSGEIGEDSPLHDEIVKVFGRIQDAVEEQEMRRTTNDADGD